MKKELVNCDRCGRTMRSALTNIDSSGKDFKLTVSGIPVYACDGCHTPLHIIESGPNLDDIITTVMHALDHLSTRSYSDPMHNPNQCRTCKHELSNLPLKTLSVQTSEKMQSGAHVLIVRFYGPAVVCDKCGTTHPVLTPVTYHDITRGLNRDSALYVRRSMH